MFVDPLYKARMQRIAAAHIIRHCKSYGGTAYLRDEALYEEAGAMLARRGFGTIERAVVAGRGHNFILRTA